MDCSRVRELLSHYYDGELPGDDRAVVAEHVNRCEPCAAEVEGFRRLSALVRHAAPKDSPNDWSDLAHRLDEDSAISLRKGFNRRQVVGLASLAVGAAILIAVVGLFAHRGEMESHDPQMAQMAADFAHYLEIFERSPSEAQEFLSNTFARMPVGHGDDRPWFAETLGESYTFQSAHVWDMPCCPCLQMVCQRSDGSMLAIFKHEQPQPMWFAGRSASEADCAGKRCTVVAMGQQLAATWEGNGWHITAVGVRDLEEMTVLVKALTDADARDRGESTI